MSVFYSEKYPALSADSETRQQMIGKPDNQKMYTELIAGILSILSDQAVRIVLYGSVARKQDTEESDVDIAVLMKGNLSSHQNKDLSSFIGRLNLKYNRVFAVIDIDESMFLEWIDSIPFFRNVENEGIVLWKAM